MQIEGTDATLSEPEEATRNGELALPLFAAGEPAHRDDPVFYMWWARALRVGYLTLRRSGDAQAALASAERTRAFMQAALRRFPGNVDLRYENASTLVVAAQAYDTWNLVNLNQPEKALATYAEAEAAYLELQRERPADGVPAYQLGTLSGGQAIVMFKLGRLMDAVEYGRRAVAYREQAMALQPENTAYRDGLAGESNNLARVLLDAGLAEEALRVAERGDAVLRALEAEDTSTPLWTERRRLFAMHRGRALLANGRPAEALEPLQQSLATMADASAGPLLRRRGWCALEIARAQGALGRTGEARAAAAAALADLQRFLEAQPGDTEALPLSEQAQALMRSFAA